MGVSFMFEEKALLAMLLLSILSEAVAVEACIWFLGTVDRLHVGTSPTLTQAAGNAWRRA